MGVQLKVLLVTGGSRGIGAEIVRLGWEAEYAVAFAYRADDDAARRIEEQARRSGAFAHGIRCDVADPEAVSALFDTAERALGPVGALVNNAGITGPLGPFAASSPETLRRVMDVNLLGTMYCAREAVRRWGEARAPGSIVNISSAAATLGAPNEYVHYAASKAAVEAFTIGLARELGPAGVRVNAVAPGTVQTGIHAAAGDPDRPARVARHIPLGRAGDPAEIAEAVMWLLSDKATYVTGAVLRVSGGL